MKCICGTRPSLVVRCSNPNHYYVVCYGCGKHTNEYTSAEEAEKEWAFLNNSQNTVEAKKDEDKKAPVPEVKRTEEPIRENRRRNRPFKRQR